MSLHTPEMSLYVHFPWCVQKCPYCDFNSHPLQGEVPEARYVGRLLQDLEQDAAWAGPRTVETIFLGGGTPSLFSPDAIQRLLAGVRNVVAVAEDAEITLEANPGAVDRASFAGYREAGVNRLSLGAQSFDPETLRSLGRIHSPDDTAFAIEAARRAGFASINLDLMHGLPHQRQLDAERDLAQALAFQTDHLSWYQLTLEPKTPFAVHPPPLPDESTLGAIEASGLASLDHAGLARYEVSAFARHGARARHNVNYWRFGDYLGIGAGAHGKVTFAAANTILRTAKPLQPRRYLASPLGELRAASDIGLDARAGEFMLNALRLIDGVEVELFETRTGLPIAAIDATRERMLRDGLMLPDRLAVTPFGLTHLDTVVSAFL